MRLGVDLFSLRNNDWNAFEFIEYCSKIGLNVVHFSDMAPFESMESSYLADVKKRADELDLLIEVGMGSMCPSSTSFRAEDGTAPEQLSRMLDVAAQLGSPALRCYLGTNADRHTSIGIRGNMEHAATAMRSVRAQALDLGVKIAVENHAGDMQGSELAELIEMAGPEFVGACIDSGNPLWVAESPFVTLKHVAPYVVMSHVRDTAVWEHPRGAVVQWVAMGEGNIGIDEWSSSFQQTCPDVNFSLEIITSIPPRVINFLDAEFWASYEQTPAAEFAQYLSLMKAGSPYTNAVLTTSGEAPPEYYEAVAVQQRRKLEQSVQYCREQLGIGE